MLAGTYAQKADRPALRAGQDAETPSRPNRQVRNSEIYTKAATRPRDPSAPRWQPGPIPATISVNVSGVARNEAGNPIRSATITLYSATDKGSKPAGTATTDSQGRYVIRDATLSVRTSFGGHPFPTEITPYAAFSLSGIAPGLGIGWSPQRSIYALKEPHPDDIQGRLPLGRPVVLDLTFPKAAVLVGKVVDEDGRPVEGAKFQVMDAVLLDDAGHETNNRLGYDDWRAMPGTVGRAVTGRDGGFRIERLPDRACFWISVNRPEPDNAMLGFYAATIDGPDTIHQKLAPGGFNGRGSDEVKTNPITMTFPKTRPIVVTVVDDLTGKPVARRRRLYARRVPGREIPLWRGDRRRGQGPAQFAAGPVHGHPLGPSDRDELHSDQPGPARSRARGRRPALRDPPKGRRRIDFSGGRRSRGQARRRCLLLESSRRSARRDPANRDVNDLVGRFLHRREGRDAGRATSRARPALPLPVRRNS